MTQEQVSKEEICEDCAEPKDLHCDECGECNCSGDHCFNCGETDCDGECEEDDDDDEQAAPENTNK